MVELVSGHRLPVVGDHRACHRCVAKSMQQVGEPLGGRRRLRTELVECGREAVDVEMGCEGGEDDIVRFEDKYGREGTNT